MYHFLHRSFPQKSAGVQCAMRISTEPIIGIVYITRVLNTVNLLFAKINHTVDRNTVDRKKTPSLYTIITLQMIKLPSGII